MEKVLFCFSGWMDIRGIKMSNDGIVDTSFIIFLNVNVRNVLWKCLGFYSINLHLRMKLIFLKSKNSFKSTENPQISTSIFTLLKLSKFCALHKNLYRNSLKRIPTLRPLSIRQLTVHIHTLLTLF